MLNIEILILAILLIHFWRYVYSFWEGNCAIDAWAIRLMRKTHRQGGLEKRAEMLCHCPLPLLAASHIPVAVSQQAGSIKGESLLVLLTSFS